MLNAMAVSVNAQQPGRDARVDVLRGLALFMIFIDHVPGNLVSLVTFAQFRLC